MQNRIIHVLFLGCLLSASVSALAYPERSIRLIVAYPPGGGTDVTARIVAPKLSELLGKQLVIDNRPGASSIIGTDLVAKATPDGHTLLLADTSLGTVPGLFTKLPFDALRDFQPIVHLTGMPIGLVIHQGVAAQSVKDLVALAKAKPGTLHFGSAGSGTTGQLAGEMLKLAAKIDIVHVPYKGVGPAYTDLLGGHLHMFFPTMQSAVPHIKSGRLRLLALTTEKRSQAFADTPTMAEAGVPGVVATAWYGILGPRGISKTVVQRVHADSIKALQDPTVKQRFESEGAEIIGGNAEQFGRFVASEIAKWSKVVKDAGIKIE